MAGLWSPGRKHWRAFWRGVFLQQLVRPGGPRELRTGPPSGGDSLFLTHPNINRIWGTGFFLPHQMLVDPGVEWAANGPISL